MITIHGASGFIVESIYEDGYKKISFKTRCVTKDGRELDAIVVIPRCDFKDGLELSVDSDTIMEIEIKE